MARARSYNAGIIGQGVFSAFFGEIGVPAKSTLRTRLVCPFDLWQNSLFCQRSMTCPGAAFPCGKLERLANSD